jgi:hypothetical protein
MKGFEKGLSGSLHWVILVLTEAEERRILDQAYIPEHIVSLMKSLSGGEPFLIDEFLCFFKKDWLMVIGYPLGSPFQRESLEKAVMKGLEQFRPVYGWFMAPEAPPLFSRLCSNRQRDNYYELDLHQSAPSEKLARIAEKASRELRVAREQQMGDEHRRLIAEFTERETLSPPVRQLYLEMPKVVNQSKTTIVLSAWSREGDLTAFYVVELAALRFAAYLIGCFSRKTYASHASDLLFHEMIVLAREQGKAFINLGLGVNEGIRRFKKKWGGTPALSYEYCEYKSKSRWLLQFLQQRV